MALLEAGHPELANAYGRVVRPEGNPRARRLLEEVFSSEDRPWRGLGVIPGSGLALRPPYDRLEARRRFALEGPPETGPKQGPCISGLILQGRRTPPQCPAFGTSCTPEHPLGAPMVSSEGACAAYHRYRRHG